MSKDLDGLIEAFQIFKKYLGDRQYNLGAEREAIYVYCSHELVSDEDKKRLLELGFYWCNEETGEAYGHGNFEYLT